MRITSDLRFAIIPEWLLDHPDLTPTALRVFAVMARYADKDSDEACRSRATLARRARCSTDTLDRALRLLRDIGAVEWDRQTDERGNAPSSYLLHFAPPPGRADAADPSRADAATSSIEDQNKKKATAACEHEGCDRPRGHRGPHRNPWWDAIAQAIYPDEGIPQHQKTLAGRLASRAQQAGHPPERILEAAAWIVDKWGAEKLTLACLNQHYERASGQLARNTEQARRRLLQLVRSRQPKPAAHQHQWEPSFAGTGMEFCAGCGTTRHVSEHRAEEI